MISRHIILQSFFLSGISTHGAYSMDENLFRTQSHESNLYELDLREKLLKQNSHIPLKSFILEHASTKEGIPDTLEISTDHYLNLMSSLIELDAKDALSLFTNHENPQDYFKNKINNFLERLIYPQIKNGFLDYFHQSLLLNFSQYSIPFTMKEWTVNMDRAAHIFSSLLGYSEVMIQSPYIKKNNITYLSKFLNYHYETIVTQIEEYYKNLHFLKASVKEDPTDLIDLYQSFKKKMHHHFGSRMGIDFSEDPYDQRIALAKKEIQQRVKEEKNELIVNVQSTVTNAMSKITSFLPWNKKKDPEKDK